MYMFKKNMLCLYIKYIYININYMNINIGRLHVNIFKIFTVCVCIYIYIINIHSTHSYIMWTTTFILDAINHLTRRADGTRDGGTWPPQIHGDPIHPPHVSVKATSVNRGLIRVSAIYISLSSGGPARRSLNVHDFWKTLLTAVSDRVPKHTCSQSAVKGVSCNDRERALYLSAQDGY